MVRRWLLKAFVVTLAAVAVAAWFAPAALWSLAVILPVAAVGFHDALQKQHTVLRNFPIVGHIRYVMERFRPEIQQYFIESNIDAYPVEREMRAIVYQRAKGELETRPFGTQRDVFQVGYEWASHSMAAHHGPAEPPRVTIGGERCSQPYSASLLNISAMSFGALSHRAIEALNRGAAMGGFAHNTGEGGIADQHLLGGDVIWQIGTGYFGCRTEDGRFDSDAFAQQSRQDAVKMVELKLSQGAKPGHGGVLPGVKVTDEIARIRMLEPGKTVISPPSHAEFDTPEGLLEFVDRLRTLSGGKPVGFKLCVGRRTDFFAICKAMLETGITPDFITVDGAEGGTGAAPVEFTDYMGLPINEGLAFVHSCLVGVNLRQKIHVIASGKVANGFDMVTKLSLGADMCNAARAFMFSVGCIQALRCNDNSCPTGVATQDPNRARAVDVPTKSVWVKNFHNATVESFLDICGAMGIDHPDALGPGHIFRRVENETMKTYGEIYPYLQPGELLGEEISTAYAADWGRASAAAF